MKKVIVFLGVLCTLNLAALPAWADTASVQPLNVETSNPMMFIGVLAVVVLAGLGFRKAG